MHKKLKTHKGTAKRVKVTGSGKLIRRHARRSHHWGRKSNKQAGRIKIDQLVPKENPRIAELLPYK